jgi:hypothetical protein
MKYQRPVSGARTIFSINIVKKIEYPHAEE